MKPHLADAKKNKGITSEQGIIDRKTGMPIVYHASVAKGPSLRWPIPIAIMYRGLFQQTDTRVVAVT